MFFEFKSFLLLFNLINFATSKWVNVWTDEFTGNSLNDNKTDKWVYSEGKLKCINKLHIINVLFF